MALPLLGAEDGRRIVDAITGPQPERPAGRRGPNARLAVQTLRLEARLRALSQDWDAVAAIAESGRALAQDVCAPPAGWIASWALGARAVASGDQVTGLRSARRAAASLRAWGERYTAARLELELLPLLDVPAAAELAAAVIDECLAVDAHASAAAARTYV
jgi:hypothetical protein